MSMVFVLSLTEPGSSFSISLRPTNTSWPPTPTFKPVIGGYPPSVSFAMKSSTRPTCSPAASSTGLLSSCVTVTRRFSRCELPVCSLIDLPAHYAAELQSAQLKRRGEEALSEHVERRKSSTAHREAYAKAMAAPSEYKPRLVTTATVRHQIHGTSRTGQFNSRLAVGITKYVGTMWAAYVFAVIGITSLVGAVTNNITLTLLAGGLSSYVLQPIIMVGQNVISASQDARAEGDHLTLTALHTMNVRQLEMLEQQAKILDQQSQILEMLRGRQAS